MSERPFDVADWRRRFFALPRVWVVEDSRGCLCGIYESKEAAEAEAAWKNRSRYSYSVRSEPICTLELSLERWS